MWWLVAMALGQTVEAPEDAVVHTEDAHRFMQALQLHESGVPLRRALVQEYRRPASVGLRDFWRINIRGVGRLSAQVQSGYAYYSKLGPELEAVEARKAQITSVFEELERQYPPAVHPDVYVVVGRLNSGGTLTDRGLLIGLDMLGRDTGVVFPEGSWLDRELKSADFFEVIVAHEMVHYQQNQRDQPSVLAKCLVEGIADFVSERLTGRTINQTAQDYGRAHEVEIWQRFQQEMLGRDTGNWLYRRPRVEGWPQDLGYFVGYRIAEAHFAQASSDEQGLTALFTWTDAQAFLAESGYAPGP